ncbi:MAG: 7-cyano-7-deazaguanine synthase QueC [Promethearchaeota archaeon]
MLLSGGIDSAVCLYWAVTEGYRAVCLSIDHHGRPSAEKVACRRLAAAAGAQLVEVDLGFLRNREGLAELPGVFQPPEHLPAAYVPFKNVVYYGVAAYYAALHRAEVVVTGLVKEDEGRFPDATPEYFEKLEALLVEGLPPGPWRGPRLAFPLREMEKVDVLRLARELGVPLEHAWSCFRDDPDLRPCGQCESCRQRAAAFEKLGWKDPATLNLSTRGSPSKC